MAYRVVLVESDPKILEELNNTLKKSPDFEVVSTYTNANDALGQSGVYNPKLFLIDIDNAKFLEMLPAFVDIYPNRIILGTMSSWNPDFAQKAAEANIAGCILKPFRANDIIEAMNLYQRRGKFKPARIVSFFSPKGRSGRTTLASLLALDVAKKSGESVALIDADLQFGDLPIFFDVEPDHTVVDAVHDIKMLTPVTLAPYFHKLTENVWLLSSPDRPEYAELVDADGLVSVIRMAGHVFRYVLVDLPAGFNPISVAVSNFADTNFVVAMINTGLEIEHMKRSLSLFKSRVREHKKTCPIFTRVHPCDEAQRVKMEMELGSPIIAIFPNEYNLVSIANSGQILRGLPPDTLMSQTIEKLSEELMYGEL